MNGFLLDTNVLSEISQFGAPPNSIVTHWLSTIDTLSLFVSVLTLAEIQKGIEKLDNGKRRKGLEEWFNDDLRPAFEDRILPVNEAIALRWTYLTATLQKQGKKPQVIDSLIAATALEHDLSVVTRNIADFEHTGVTLIDPWKSSLH